MQSTSLLHMTHKLKGFFPTLPLDNTAVEGGSTFPDSQEEIWWRKGAFHPALRQVPQQPTATGRENSLSPLVTASSHFSLGMAMTGLV